MAGRSEGRYSNDNEGNNDNDEEMTCEANNSEGQFHTNWDCTIDDLVDDQLLSEFSNQNGPSRNNLGQQSYSKRSHSPDNDDGLKGFSSWSLKKESCTGWYSVEVPNIKNSGKILKLIQTYIAPVEFYPYNKKHFNNSLGFLVDDYGVAKVLDNANFKITQKNSRKLVINVSLYLPPRSLTSLSTVSSELKEKIIEAIATRYNSSTKSLDLSHFHACPLFTNNQLFAPLNRPTIFLAVINRAAQYTKHDLYGLSLENNNIYLGEGFIWIRRFFPELKVLDLAENKFSNLKELKCLSGYTIEILNLSRNPVSSAMDKECYKRDLQQIFPTLTKLDNSELPSQYSAIRSKFKMPISLGNCYPIPQRHNSKLPNPVMTLVESFLTQYYEHYDNQVSRRMISEAYHENAIFTLSSCLLHEDLRGNLSRYLHESRNFLKSDRSKQERGFLHKGKKNILNFLNKLPKSKHDLSSFIVDVPFATATMIQIVLNGVFAEDFKIYDFNPLYRSFCRTFCIVPFGNGWSIISDMFFITIVTDELLLETSKRFNIFILNLESSERNNSDSNSNQNVSIFLKDTNKMTGIKSSLFGLQLPTPSYLPPSFKQSTLSSYQPSPMFAPINSQQSSSHQGGMQTFTIPIQKMAPVATVNFQPNSQQQPASSFNVFNTISLSTALNIASLPLNQLSMVKRFSNEFGMNNEQAKK
ncbi:nuclear RNA export factor 1-like [Melanaphis sacchari]|uniref:nuclear RNA export factor 1-like n=1 Tax=Melanaphis sacchari TaxID=742174 RepID=UPI000DC1581B|nr:nuclear RNA export factor 1-like [Melanaphis sacchari]